jgi:hypothetical protein
VLEEINCACVNQIEIVAQRYEVMSVQLVKGLGFYRFIPGFFLSAMEIGSSSYMGFRYSKWGSQGVWLVY